MQKEKKSNTGVVWFRNDLRTIDQRALYQAVANHQRVIGVYCFDPRHFGETRFGFPKTGAFRTRFLLESVAALRQQLQKLNIPLFVFHEKPEVIIPSFCSENHAVAIYFQKEWTSEEKAVEAAVRSKLPADTITIRSYYDQFLYHPASIPFDRDSIPRVFTEFRKQLEKSSEVHDTISITAMPAENFVDTGSMLPTIESLGSSCPETHPNSAFPFKGGETAALERLQHYTFETKHLGHYKQTRNGLIGTEYSSKLSAWLSLGCISPRTIFETVKQYEEEVEKSQDTYWLIFELIWRDFFKYISMKHGNKIFQQEGILNKSQSWEQDDALIASWINGETESDFVNANMVEFRKTGWMSNRGRQNVASYFAKELNQDWRIGASYFESQLIDYDVHSNYGNWMYVAGVGNDPRNRKFNVQQQAKHYDPDGAYRSLWLSENEAT